MQVESCDYMLTKPYSADAREVLSKACYRATGPCIVMLWASRPSKRLHENFRKSSFANENKHKNEVSERFDIALFFQA